MWVSLYVCVGGLSGVAVSVCQYPWGCLLFYVLATSEVILVTATDLEQCMYVCMYVFMGMFVSLYSCLMHT